MPREHEKLVVDVVLHLCQSSTPLPQEVPLSIAAFLTSSEEITDDTLGFWGHHATRYDRLDFEEIWSVRPQDSWLLSCSQVDRHLRELIVPVIWHDVALLTGGYTQRLDLIDLLTRHLIKKGPLVKKLRFAPLCEFDLLHRSAEPLDDPEDFFSHTDCKYKTQSHFEEAVERMCSSFPEQLHSFHYECGQLRLTPSAWRWIAKRCTRLTVLRLDARQERSPFSIRHRGAEHTVDPYPQYEEAVGEITSVRGASLGWGDEEHDCFPENHFRYGFSPHIEAGKADQERIAGGSHSISQWLRDSRNLLWLRLAAPPLTWQPSLLPVWARVLGLITAPISEGPGTIGTHTSAFVAGSRDHIEDFGWEQYDIQYDAAAMALRPALDRLAKVAVDTVLDLVWTQDVFAIWREPRQKQGLGDYVGPLFGHRDISECSDVEVQRLQSIVTSWTSTQQHRAEERARGCPFEGIEWMEENTVESALEYAKIQRASAGIT